MSEQIKFIRIDSVFVRAVPIAMMVVALAFAWFSIRWQIGDMLGELTSPAEQDADRIASAAITLAPTDPRGYWLAGSVRRASFDEASIDSSTSLFKDGVLRSPFYHRSWTELGRANEQVEQNENAERAFRRAVDLAPEYSIPRWQLGNFYLRQGRVDDAIRELRIASKHNSPYRHQVFAIAWNVLGNDPRQVEQFASDEPDVRAALAYFYGTRNRPDDALRVWNMLDEDQKVRFKWHNNAIARDLGNQNSLITAIEFSRQAGIDPTARVEAITNGDFETPIKETQTPMFDWVIYRTDGKIEITRDTGTKRSGSHALRLTFRGYAKPPLNNLQQTIAVRPGSRHRLSFWIRTENLKSGSMPLFEIRNSFDNTVNVFSPPFPSGTSDWRQISTEFTVPENSEGVYIRTTREPCPVECPLTGIVWLDDFELARI